MQLNPFFFSSNFVLNWTAAHRCLQFLPLWRISVWIHGMQMNLLQQILLFKPSQATSEKYTLWQKVSSQKVISLSSKGRCWVLCDGFLMHFVTSGDSVILVENYISLLWREAWNDLVLLPTGVVKTKQAPLFKSQFGSKLLVGTDVMTWLQ